MSIVSVGREELELLDRVDDEDEDEDESSVTVTTSFGARVGWPIWSSL
jgi:hypothetical protein